MSQRRYHDRKKIQAYLDKLENYRDLQRPIQFQQDGWDACYQGEVQLKAARTLDFWTLKAAKAKETGKSNRNLKDLEAKVAQMQQIAA